MKYIASFDDLAPIADQVRLRNGDSVLVNGLELNQLGALIFKHASLQAAFEDGTTSLFEAILSGGKEVVHDFIREATGISGNVSRLTGTEQANIILACLALTIPETDEEVADFLDQIVAFRARAVLAVKHAKAKGLRMPGRKPKRG